MDRISSFRTLVEDVEKSAHGCDLSKVKSFMEKTFSRTSEREIFLKDLLTRKPISWVSINKSTWKTENERILNKFFFIQGDIVKTTMVSALGIAESEQDHDNWMVLSPDCDCIRSRHIRVAPIFQVPPEKSEHAQRYSLALKFSNCKAFYIPLIKEEIDSGIRGFYADLEEPFYLAEEYKGLAVQTRSLSLIGWHLLNATLQEQATRAQNLQEAKLLRSDH